LSLSEKALMLLEKKHIDLNNYECENNKK